MKPRSQGSKGGGGLGLVTGLSPATLAALMVSLAALYKSVSQEIRIEDVEERIRELLVKTEHMSAESGVREKRSADPEATVEFVHPEYKGDLTSATAAEWLTTYARVPLEVIHDFCLAADARCPRAKGDPGMPGVPGLKGRRGRPGRGGPKGAPGHQGPTGPPGPRGQKGDRGKQGHQGLDGRDGLPGEPGLDGVPGRNGFDGIRGEDGIPGLPGSPGVPGTNGKDGRKGEGGLRGVRGPPGERGLPGPRGRAGKDGRDGGRGEPGISVWKVQQQPQPQQQQSQHPVRGPAPKQTSALLIPPSITGLNDPPPKITVKEGEHLRLRCVTAGLPKPTVAWTRQDGRAFPDGAWKYSHAEGSTLNLTRANREHMGEYRCDADNGIPPAAKKTFKVEVQFPPLLTIQNRVVGSYVGSSALLECLVEAFPRATTTWERYDGLILKEDWEDKFRLSEGELSSYLVRATLNVTVTSSNDFGMYYCRSHNEQGLAKAGVNLFEVERGAVAPPPILNGGLRPLVVGERPPPFAESGSLCPVSREQDCPECPRPEQVLCEILDRTAIDVLPYESSLRALKNRTSSCTIQMVGKPVLKRTPVLLEETLRLGSRVARRADPMGTWMMDAHSKSDRVWETNEHHRNTLLEYQDQNAFKNAEPVAMNYSLPLPFEGNDHVMYNGTFYYYNRAEEAVVGFHLASGRSNILKIPRNAANEGRQGAMLTNIYSPHHESSFVDFSADENGVWATFALSLNNHTVVMKFGPDEDAPSSSSTPPPLRPEYMWETSLDPATVTDTFVACGVLYGVEPDRRRRSSLRIAFSVDLYTSRVSELDLTFVNVYGRMTMLNYNPVIPALTSWDGGNPLSYPVKFDHSTPPPVPPHRDHTIPDVG